GMLITRDTGKYVVLLIVEAIFGLLVVLANIIIISVILAGWKKLLRNPFYVILSNLLVLTSMKGLVELGFILPYYIMQRNLMQKYAYFSEQYELFIFNLSVLSDYGVLFFSLLIAVNRYFAVKATYAEVFSGFFPKYFFFEISSLKTACSCAITWICSATIPIFFFFCECEYVYHSSVKIYYNYCADQHSPIVMAILRFLIYLSYSCAIILFLLYLLIFQKRKMSSIERSSRFSSNESSVQMRLLKQSIVVFVLYASVPETVQYILLALIVHFQCSMSSVFALSFLTPEEVGHFQIAYVENLMNLSIAAVYPICFLVMSGDINRLV
ncbi:hypothetical protein PFISCL1PPCAC_25414, partial [Pristionchus fissidentatus]